jgi:amino-acid racemase
LKQFKPDLAKIDEDNFLFNCDLQERALMKTIGLLGGMSWESNSLYYRCINQAVKKKLGGLHSAKIVMVSVDFYEIEQHMKDEQWGRVEQILGRAAKQIETAGADFMLICTNTMHKLAPQIQNYISIPLLHIADATAESVKKKNMTSIGLLGTRFTMEEDFYKGRLEDHGIDVIVPSKKDRERVDQIIFKELCLGIVREESRQHYLRIIDQMHRDGAQGIIEGCTEIVILVQQHHTTIPLFDTTEIHGKKAASLALNEY